MTKISTARATEQSVIGQMLIENKCLPTVFSALGPNFEFGHLEEQVVYEAIVAIYRSGRDVDLRTVSHEMVKLETNKVVDAQMLANYTLKVSSTQHIETHLSIIKQEYARRQMLRLFQQHQIALNSESCDPLHILEKVQEGITKVFGEIVSGETKSAGVIIEEAMNDIIARAKAKGSDQINGVATGFVDFDLMLNGLGKSELIILAGRPGMGKSSFAQAVCTNIFHKFGRNAMFCSLEMSNRSVMVRMLAMQSGVPVNFINRGDLVETQLNDIKTARQEFQSSKRHLYLDDTASMTVNQLRSKAKMVHDQHGLDCLIVDYLQLMTGEGENQQVKVSNISRGLKLIAKELDIPVIALSQLSRSVETRGGDKRPMLSDLRDSGAIEQDADKVIFVYRPKYYGIVGTDSQGNPSENVVELIVSKHREGAVGTIYLTIDPSTHRWFSE